VEKESQLRLLRKAFSDISRGYSVVFFKGRKLYIKHLSHHEQVDLDVLYKNFLELGKKEGLPTEEYMLKFLKDEGVWTDKDDKELEDIQTIIERLVTGKKVIYLKSDLDRQNKEIEAQQKRYYEKKAQRERLLGLTAEAWADKKVNEHYIVESFYVDEGCKTRWLEGETFDNLSEAEMQQIVKVYNEEIETVSDRNVKKLAIQDFFQIYWSLSSENLHDFFGKPICDLTYFQVKVGSYGRMFRNILEKAEGFPEDVKNDPDKLLDYVRAGENAKERMEKAAQGSPSHETEGTVASTLFGAKQDELKEIGIQSDPGTTSLSTQLKKAQAEGKKGLNMQDMMKLMGV
jgi:Zn-finger nucleic acid-binding protein